jgi:hypothetical protein
VQRRLQTTRQREQEANESELCQLHGLGSGQTRVMDWWRFEDGGGATRLASTCSSTCCDHRRRDQDWRAQPEMGVRRRVLRPVRRRGRPLE